MISLLVLGVFGIDQDARYRANRDGQQVESKFCAQQNALRSLPTKYVLPPHPDLATRQIVHSVLDIQRSGADLYVKFDCAAKGSY